MVDSCAHVHYALPCFERVGPLSEDVVLQAWRRALISSFFYGDAVLPHQCRDKSICTATGAGHQQCKGESMGLELTKPPSQTYTKFLGMEPTDTRYIHDTHKCMRAFRKPSRFSSSQDIIPYIFIVPHQSQQV